MAAKCGECMRCPCVCDYLERIAPSPCSCTEVPCKCDAQGVFDSIRKSDSRYGMVVPRVHIVKAGEHTYKISDGKEYILRNIRGGGEPYWQEIK